jgi:hypothetical protein
VGDWSVVAELDEFVEDRKVEGRRRPFQLDAEDPNKPIGQITIVILFHLPRHCGSQLIQFPPQSLQFIIVGDSGGQEIRQILPAIEYLVINYRTETLSTLLVGS